MPQQTESTRASWWRISSTSERVRRHDLVDRRVLITAILLVIVVLGAWLRLSDANWDSGQHLHPDERYLTEVETAIRWPDSIGQYFDVHSSPLSPYNTETGKHYVYGQLPLFGVKLLGTGLGQEDYAQVNIVGRHLSALIDTGSILLVFLLAKMIFGRFGTRAASAGALLATALYAFTATAIQAAHFFTTDSWLVFFGLLTFVIAARALRTAASAPRSRFRAIHVLIGVSFGLTIACKISGALIAAPVFIALLAEAALAAKRVGVVDAAVRAGAAGLTILVAAYIAFRSVSPYAFASSNWFDVRISPAYRAALTEQRDLLNGKILIPPSYQWLLSPRLDPLKNLVVWQLGIALGIAAIAGLLVMGVSLVGGVARLRRRAERHALELQRLPDLALLAMLVVFVLLVFFYFGSDFAHTGRYLLPLVPFAVIAAAYGVLALNRTRLALPVAAVIVAATALYAVAYHHIYTVPTTRVAASNWIIEHVPPGTAVANEHWDDSLPLGSDAAQSYSSMTLPVFDPDDETKLKKLYDGLTASDYYFLSSPRAWRTIGRLRDRFPIMTRYYRALFDGRLGFTRVARFSSEPELLGVHLDDIGAEEALWVYDHPRVLIYKKFRLLSWPAFRAVLCSPAPLPPGCA